MQSFLQYRRFRATVEAQIAKDKAHLRGQSQHRSGDEELSNSSSVDDGSKVDLEKGDALGPPLEPSPPSHGVWPGDVNPNEYPPLPKDESHRVEQNQRPEEYQEAVEEKPEEDLEDDDDDDFELNQNVCHTLSRTTTQQSVGTALGVALTGIDVRTRTTKEGGEGNVFVVGYESESDPMDPHNWSLSKRIRCTLPLAGVGAVVGFASSIDSSAIPQAAKEFGVSEVAESLATALFLAGFGLGGLFAGPISETVGRNPVYIATLGLYMVFIMASALAPNLGSQLAFRFIAGVFGSTPLTCAGGSISDLYTPLERVWAFPVFANAAFTGPLLGPILGGFIAQSSTASWRWVEWSELKSKHRFVQ